MNSVFSVEIPDESCVHGLSKQLRFLEQLLKFKRHGFKFNVAVADLQDFVLYDKHDVIYGYYQILEHISKLVQQVQSPQAQLPQVQLPQVQLPQVQLPQAQLPQVQQPQAQSSQVQMPLRVDRGQKKQMYADDPKEDSFGSQVSDLMEKFSKQRTGQQMQYMPKRGYVAQQMMDKDESTSIIPPQASMSLPQASQSQASQSQASQQQALQSSTRSEGAQSASQRAKKKNGKIDITKLMNDICKEPAQQ